jgi:SRSO17 transposase
MTIKNLNFKKKECKGDCQDCSQYWRCISDFMKANYKRYRCEVCGKFARYRISIYDRHLDLVFKYRVCSLECLKKAMGNKVGVENV